MDKDERIKKDLKYLDNIDGIKVEILDPNNEFNVAIKMNYFDLKNNPEIEKIFKCIIKLADS